MGRGLRVWHGWVSLNDDAETIDERDWPPRQDSVPTR